MAIVLAKHVLWLEIPMSDPVRMTKTDGVQQLNEHMADQLVFGQVGFVNADLSEQVEGGTVGQDEESVGRGEECFV